MPGLRELEAYSPSNSIESFAVAPQLLPAFTERGSDRVRYNLCLSVVTYLSCFGDFAKVRQNDDEPGSYFFQFSSRLLGGGGGVTPRAIMTFLIAATVSNEGLKLPGR